MSNTENLAPNVALDPHTPHSRRGWTVDDIIVSIFAVMGLGGAVYLPLRSNIPPITTSFLLSTGLAALTYRYLGGIHAVTFRVGTLKLTGALGALVGIALLVNHAMISETPRSQVWEVNGQIVGDSGQPIAPLLENDVLILPSIISKYPNGKFSVKVLSEPNENGETKFPLIVVGHAGYSSQPIELDPGAQSDIKITRDRHEIQLNQIILKPLPPEAAGHK